MKNVSSYKRVGLTRVRDCCTFAWSKPVDGGRRTAHVGRQHCDACVNQLREEGYQLLFNETGIPDGDSSAGERGSGGKA